MVYKTDRVMELLKSLFRQTSFVMYQGKVKFNEGGRILNLLRSMGIGVVSFFITLFLLMISFYFSFPAIINLIIVDVFIIFLFTLFIFIIFSKGKEKKEPKKESLFQWMEELPDFDNYLMSILKGRNAKYKTIDNLKVIKRLIMSLTKKNKETLKLYKAFYAHRSKESSDELYLKTILVIIPTITLYFIRDYLPGLVNGNDNILLLILVFLFITIAAITDRLNHNKKRIGLFIDLIEICIEEIEQEEKKNLEK